MTAIPQRGQGTIEWIALILLVALLLLALLAAGGRLPGGALAQTIAEKIICAVELDEGCDPELESTYGEEIAALTRRHAPDLLYERGMAALPVDYRHCREDRCSFGPGGGLVWRSLDGQAATAFVHVVDCRPPHAARTDARGMDCSGGRAGNLYLQYWFYYPGSATGEGRILNEAIRQVSTAVGRPSYHPDDWESFQVRVGPAGTHSRASSHHSHSGWAAGGSSLYVSGGSHAGRTTPEPAWRRTPRGRLTLIPLDPIAARSRLPGFAITAPWQKAVWRDPEAEPTA